jgi:electron transfer flavoprotein beta subunit
VHIVVCVKMVPDTTQVSIDPITNTLVREGVPFITNPFDDHAVEEALRLKDAYGAKVTVLSMGPAPAEAVIRKAIALGADAGLLLSDRAFGGSDTLATSKVISEAIAKLSVQERVDLIVCGKQTIDGDTAQVGPGIATRLGFAQVTLVDKVLDLDLEAGTITVRAKFDNRHQIVEARLPALITVVREINTLRYPTVPRRLYAEEVNVPVWTNGTLKLDPNTIGLNGSPTWVKRIFAPEREKGEIVMGLNGHKEEAVRLIVQKLEDWKVLDS